MISCPHCFGPEVDIMAIACGSAHLIAGGKKEKEREVVVPLSPLKTHINDIKTIQFGPIC